MNEYLLLKASAFQLPLADQSVQCVVTSPPYFAKRVYDGQGSPDAYGLEPTPEAYIARTLEWMREVRRVLRDDGCLFVNIGDTYWGSSKGAGGSGPRSTKQVSNPGSYHEYERLGRITGAGAKHPVLKPKDACLIPERLAIAAQEDGWYVRNRIIWNKTNVMCMPLRDRFLDATEHIWLFTKQARYFWDVDAAKEPADPKHFARYRYKQRTKPGNPNVIEHEGDRKVIEMRVMRNVWTFANGSVRGSAHTAAFNPELPRRCIVAASRPGDIVLDPFTGSGTTGLAALHLGRRFVGTDLAYHDDARRRIEESLRKCQVAEAGKPAAEVNPSPVPAV